MVVKGLLRITNFGHPNELLNTQFGVIKRKRWQEQEAKRFPDSKILTDSRGFIALFVKGEEYAGSES